MRVVAGERKGMPLKALAGNNTRPTTDKVKESIFNMIGPFFDGGVALDLFAGSGGLGLEALSRGVEKVIFVEKDRKAFSIVKENVAKCRYDEQAEVFCNDAVRAVKALVKREDVVFDVVLFDPPYHKAEYYDLVRVLIDHGKIDLKGVIMCEHATDVTLPETYGPFTRVRQETYSSTVVSIYRVTQQEEGE
ncbi:MAG: 16S rRNA (guanine(966)-N(2))-methyltransferase RsmD [Caryophanon sp.]|nr:16S rRNA (guanine(966)-N(2))-methyltransferase RsmD [Caryophanon sp.]